MDMDLCHNFRNAFPSAERLESSFMFCSGRRGLAMLLALEVSSKLLDDDWKPMSESPRVFLHEHFLTKEECEELKALALRSGRLQEATVYTGQNKAWRWMMESPWVKDANMKLH